MTLRSRVTRRFVFAATLALLLLGAFLPSSRVSSKAAYPRYSEEITYYSDASHTQQVGTGMIYCNGRGTLTGTSTPYHTEEIIDVCCPDPNGGVPC
jgi:hypothetical protein